MRLFILNPNFKKIIFVSCLCVIAFILQANNSDAKSFDQNLDSFNFKKMNPDDCILKYKIMLDTLTIAFISNEGISSKKYNSTTLLQEIQQFKRAIKTHGNQLEDIIYGLSDKLIKPFSTNIIKHNNITIIPDQSFQGLAFECLLIQDNLLVQTHTIAYHYTLKNFFKSNNQNMSPSICLMAPIVEGNKTQNAYVRSSTNSHLALPYTFNEVKNTEQIFKRMHLSCKTYYNQQATANNLEKAIETQNIVHIASHGDNKNNGIFIRESNTSEKYNLESFDGSSLQNAKIKTDLIVLSACKTATSMPNESSLLLHVLEKGIPNVIGSLWNVHDKKTETFMSLFYKHLIEDKLCYAQALRLTKIDCIKQGFLPMDWAGFVLFGQ